MAELIQGVRTKLVLVSYSHGAIRVPLAQSLNYTPKITERNINEFDNLEVAQVVTTFEGADVSFDYLDTDSKLVDAMFADVNPAADVVIDDPSNYQRVTGFANMKGIDSGKIIASILIKQGRAKGSPYTEPVLEEARVTRDLSANNVLKIKGNAIQYDRFVSSGWSGAGTYRQVAPTPNVNNDVVLLGVSGWSGSLTKPAVIYDGASGYNLYVIKNGVEVTDLTTYTMTSTVFAANALPSSGDVWEVYYLWKDV